MSHVCEIAVAKADIVNGNFYIHWILITSKNKQKKKEVKIKTKTSLYCIKNTA